MFDSHCVAGIALSGRPSSRTLLRERTSNSVDGVDGGVRVVVAENLAEISSVGSHGFGSRLAQAHAVALSPPFHQDLSALLFHGELVAGNRVPAEAARGAYASGLVGTAERCCIFGRD